MLTLVFGLAALMSLAAGKNFMGPFDVLIKEPFDCEDQGTREIYFNETIIRKTGRRSFKMTTNVYLAIPLSDDLQIVANFAVWGNGGWRPNFLTLQEKACSMFQDRAPDLFKQALESVNLPLECPIPVGAYRWNDINPAPKIDIAQLPYNKYKIYIEFRKNDGSLTGCLGLITHIVPKESKKG